MLDMYSNLLIYYMNNSGQEQISKALINKLVARLKANPSLFIEDVVKDSGVTGYAAFELAEVLNELV